MAERSGASDAARRASAEDREVKGAGAFSPFGAPEHSKRRGNRRGREKLV